MPKVNEFKYDVSTVLSLYSEGLSSNRVSIILGIPRSTVDAYIKKAGVGRPTPKSTERRNEGEIEKLCTKCRIYKLKAENFTGDEPRCKSCRKIADSLRPKERAQFVSKQWRNKLRLTVISHYSEGTNACACCSEKIIEFLAIDHINGGGNKHRKSINKKGTTFFRWLQKHNFPSGYRVLCANCNFSLGHYGYCPHERGGNAKS